MEKNPKDTGSKDREQSKTVDEDLAHLLGAIKTEINELTDSVLPEERLLDDVDLSAEEVSAEITRDLLDTGEFELDSKPVGDLASPLSEVEPVDEDSETELDTSVDNQGEEEKMLTEQEVVSRDQNTATTGQVVVENTRSFDVAGSEVEVEGRRDAAGKNSNLDSSINEIAVLTNRKMEEVLVRLVEERMPAMLERTIVETVKRILLSI